MIKILVTYLLIVSFIFVPGSFGQAASNLVNPSDFTQVTIGELVSDPKEHN